MTTYPDIAVLKELATKATPGPWTLDGKNHAWSPEATYEPTICYVDEWRVVLEGARRYDMHSECEVDAAYIAGASPSTILALIERLERAEKALEPFADIANFMDSETTGFAMSDELSLICRGDDGAESGLFKDFKVGDFYKARAALSGGTHERD